MALEKNGKKYSNLTSVAVIFLEVYFALNSIVYNHNNVLTFYWIKDAIRAWLSEKKGNKALSLQ